MKPWILVAALALVGCPHPMPEPDAGPPPDGDSGSADIDGAIDSVTAACKSLNALRCAAGGPNCVSALRAGQAARISDFKPACLAHAKTVADVEACGTVKCER